MDNVPGHDEPKDVPKRESIFEEIEPDKLAGFDPSYMQVANRFLEMEKVDFEEPIYYLYKYDHPTTGKSKSFVRKYVHGEPPDEEDIGKEFGSGRYLLCLWVPASENRESKMRSYMLRLNQRFDDLMLRNKKEKPETQAAPAAMAQQTGFRETMDVMERIMAIFTPLITPLINRPREESPKELIQQMYSTVGDIMKSQVADNMNMITEFKRRAIEGDNKEMESNTLTENQPSVVEQLIPLINEWLPKLVGGGAKAAAVSEVVRMTPQFKSIVQNRVELVRIIKYLDDTRTPTETDKILSALRIRRPVPPAQPVQPVQQVQVVPSAPVPPVRQSGKKVVAVSPRGLKQRGK